MLKFLASQAGQVITREVLLEKVWGYEYYGDIRTVDVTVRRIRGKIEKDTAFQRLSELSREYADRWTDMDPEIGDLVPYA